MHFLLILLCLPCIVFATLEDRKQWINFKTQHGKVYKNLQEEEFRFSVFQQNVRSIEEHNKKYDMRETTYTQKVTFLADLTKEEVISMLNHQNIGRSNNDSYSDHKNVVGDELPDSIDWREKGAVSEVKNQGMCGSSVVFSVVGTLEGFNYVKIDKLVTLSGQQLMDCSTNGGVCSGVDENTVLQYVKKYGIETEESYPYGNESICRYNESAVFLKIKDFDYIQTKNEGELLSAVGLLGPVSVTLDATELGFYQEGVFSSDSCSQDITNHAVLAVGYGKDEITGLDYWLVKNSWGLNWGEEGYFKIKRGVNECGIATNAVYPVLY